MLVTISLALHLHDELVEFLGQAFLVVVGSLRMGILSTLPFF